MSSTASAASQAGLRETCFAIEPAGSSIDGLDIQFMVAMLGCSGEAYRTPASRTQGRYQAWPSEGPLLATTALLSSSSNATGAQIARSPALGVSGLGTI